MLRYQNGRIRAFQRRCWGQWTNPSAATAAMAVKVIVGRCQRAMPATAAMPARPSTHRIERWAPSPPSSSGKKRFSRTSCSFSHPMSLRYVRRNRKGMVQKAETRPPSTPMVSAHQVRRSSAASSPPTNTIRTASLGAGSELSCHIATVTAAPAPITNAAELPPRSSGSRWRPRTATITTVAPTAKRSGIRWLSPTSASTTAAHTRPLPVSSDRNTRPRYTRASDRLIENANSPASVDAMLPP